MNNERKPLNKLIVKIIRSDGEQSAMNLYSEIGSKTPEVLSANHVKSYRSFVKIINGFSNLESEKQGGAQVYFTKGKR